MSAVAAVAAMTLGVAACGSSSSSSPGQQSGGGNKGKAPQVVFLPKLLGPTYFTAALNGGKQAASQLGGTVSQVGPSTATPAGQITYINSLTAQGVKAIAIAGDDPAALRPSLKLAMAHGLKVVSYDSDVAPDARQVFLDQASAQGVATAVLQQLAKGVHYSGQVAIVSSTPTNTNQNAWIDVIKSELKQRQYSKMQLVPVVYGQDLPPTVQQTVANLLRAYPNLKGIAAITGVAEPAAAAELEAEHKGGKVVLTGVAVPSDMRKYIKDGTAQSAVLWDVVKLGYITYYAAAALESGQIKGKPGDTFTAGKYGKYTIGPNGTVVMGPPTVFDKSNIDSVSF